MAINPDFLSQITDALVDRASDPGKLDDVARQFGSIVRDLEKSVKNVDQLERSSKRLFNEFHKTFKEATQQARVRIAKVPGAEQLSAQELTKVSNKISGSLRDSLAALVRQNSQLGRSFLRELAENRAAERRWLTQSIAQQVKLETKGARALPAATFAPDPRSFQAQLARESARLERLREAKGKVVQTREQLLLGELRQEVRGMQRSLRTTLGEVSRQMWSRPQISGYTYEMRPREGPERPMMRLSETYPSLSIAGMYGGITARSRRPASSTDYGIKKGSGQSADVTPSLLSGYALTLQNQLSTVNEYKRNLDRALKGGPSQAASFYQLRGQQSAFQEEKQQKLGALHPSKEGVRSGEMLALAVMAGANAQIFNESRPEYRAQQRRQRRASALLQDPRYLGKMAEARGMLGQPWAQPPVMGRERWRGTLLPGERPPAFASEKIKEFVGKYRRNPSVDAVQTAAQMANVVGSTGPRSHELLDIVLGGQAQGRQIAAGKVAEAREAEVKRLAGAAGGGTSKVGAMFAEARQRLADAGLIGPSGRRGFGTAEFMAGPFGLGATAREYFAKRRTARWSAQFSAPVGGQLPPEQRPPTYEERARQILSGGAIPSAGGLRGELRRDVLESKLKRLADAAEATTKAFQHYRDVVVPQRAGDIQRQYRDRGFAVAQGLQARELGLDVAAQRVAARRAMAGTLIDRRLDRGKGAAAAQEAKLAAQSLSAEGALYTARERQQAVRERLAQGLSSYGANKKRALAAIDARLAGMTRPAELRVTRAEYARKAAGMTDPVALARLRAETAEQMATQMYGTKTGEVPYLPGQTYEHLKTRYQQTAMESMGGPTLAQRKQALIGQISEDRVAKEKEFTQQEEVIGKRRQASKDKARAQDISNEEKYGGRKAKLAEDVAQKEVKAQARVADAKKKQQEAAVKYLKQEDVALGRGAGGGGTGAGGRGGLGSARSGYGVGLGMAALIGYDAAMKSLIKDMAIYSARTQMMEVATSNMARVSGLNVDAVNEEVEALKRRNLTTQIAQQTVQRLMMMQIDLAKATKLVGVAQDLAAVSGADAMETVTRLTQAVLTGYTRNLHMMGLMVTSIGVIKEVRAQRRAEGKGGEPSVSEQRQALVNRIILEGAKIAGTYERSMSTAGGQFAYLRKEIQETMNVLGKEFLPTFSTLMLSMSGGLRFVQAHGEAFGTLAKVVTSLSVAISALGTLAFARYLFGMMGGGAALGAAVPWLALVAGGTYALLNRNKSQANIGLAAQQQSLIQEQVGRLVGARAELLKYQGQKPGEYREGAKYPGGAAQWRSDLDSNTMALKSYAAQAKLVEEDLTKKNAEEYNKRIKNLDDFIAAYTDKASSFSDKITGFMGIFSPVLGGGPVQAVPKPGESLVDAAKRSKEEIARKLVGSEAIARDPRAVERMKAEAARQREQETLEGRIPAGMVNVVQKNAADFALALQSSGTVLEKYAEQVDESTGRLMRRALESFGTPEEKARIDYEFALADIEKSYREIDEHEKVRAAAERPGATDVEKLQYRADVEAAGRGGGYEAGLLEIEKAKKERKDTEEGLRRIRNITVGHAAIQADMQIAKIREQTKVEEILGKVIKGNYESEMAGAEEVRKVRQANFELDKKRMPLATETLRIAQAEIREGPKQVSVALTNARIAADRAREEERARDEAEQRAQLVLVAPGDAAQAIRDAFAERIRGTRAIKDENARLDEQRRLLHGLEVDLANLGLARKRAAAEVRVEEYEARLGLVEQIGRATGRGGLTARQQALAEIELRRSLQVGAAEERYRTMRSVTPAEGQDALEAQRRLSVQQANVQAASETIKLAEQRVQTMVERLRERYQQQVSDAQQMAELAATSASEEQVAARNAHDQRIGYIDKERDARIAADGEIDEVDRDLAKERHDAEMEYLQVLYQQRQKQIEGIRSISGSLFDIVTSKQPNKQRQARDFGIGLAKDLGRTVFSNVAVDALKRGVGSISIPGQTKQVYNPKTGKMEEQATWLGRILSGTPFGKSATEKQIAEQQKRVLEATEANTRAEDALTRAIEDLTAAIEAARGVASGGGAPGASYTPLRRPIGWSPQLDLPQLLGSAWPGSPAMYALPPGEGGDIYGGAPDLSGPGGQSPPGATWPGTNVPIPAGTGGGTPGAAPVPTSAAGKAQSKLLGAAMAAGGAYQAYSGFKKGGGSGIASGIGGTLMMGAGVASMFGPAGAPVAAALFGGAMVADLISSVLGSSREQRAIDVQKYLDTQKYLAPTQLAREMDVSGNLVSTAAKGGLSRDVGIPAFPIDFTQTQYGRTPSKTWADPNVPEYYTIPGQQTYGNLPGSAQPITYNIHLPISAFDAKDVIARSGDIARAIKKELYAGSDLSANLQQAVFGAG